MDYLVRVLDNTDLGSPRTHTKKDNRINLLAINTVVAFLGQVHPPTQTTSEYPYSYNPSSLPAMAFTLFFSGKEYAPNRIIYGVNILEWLQSKYLGALAARIVQWESGEKGREGHRLGLHINPTRQGSILKKGTHPTACQIVIDSGMGKVQIVENYKFGSLGRRKMVL